MNNRILKNHVTVGLMETDHLNSENWNLEIGSDNYDYHESVGFTFSLTHFYFTSLSHLSTQKHIVLIVQTVTRICAVIARDFNNIHTFHFVLPIFFFSILIPYT